MNRHVDPDAALARMRAFIREPLTALPVEWQPPLFGFWMRWGHLLKDDLLTLCMRVSDYRESGVSLKGMRKIFGLVNAAESREPIRFASDLFGILCAMAGEMVRQKRAAEAREAERLRLEADQKNGGIVAGLANCFRTPPVDPMNPERTLTDERRSKETPGNGKDSPRKETPGADPGPKAG